MTAHLADRLVSSLSTRFGNRLPPHLGREVRDHIKSRLRTEGFFDNFHAEEVLSMALVSALKYLDQHEGEEVRQPRAWFHTLCAHACIEYLKTISEPATHALAEVLEGEVELADNTVVSEEHTLAVVRRAIEHLRPRHKQFVVFDLIECLPAAKIQEIMHLSNGAFRKLKHDAFTAMREAIRREGVAQL